MATPASSSLSCPALIQALQRKYAEGSHCRLSCEECQFGPVTTPCIIDYCTSPYSAEVSTLAGRKECSGCTVAGTPGQEFVMALSRCKNV
jgi:hypothetical protein